MTGQSERSGADAAPKVLIVEDEFLVALQLEEIIADAGYDVVGIAPDTATARTLPAPPTVALVDLNLRDGLSGPSIAWHLSETYGTAIVYVTANPLQIGQPAPTAVGVVQKPFSPEAILAAISFAAGSAGDYGARAHGELRAIATPAGVPGSSGDRFAMAARLASQPAASTVSARCS